MPRKTRYLLYVDPAVMKDPDGMFDATITHFIKKGLEIGQRRRFIAEFMKAVTPEEKLVVVNNWVQVRDIASFPYTAPGKQGDDPAEGAEDEDTGVEGGVPVDAEPAEDEGAASE